MKTKIALAAIILVLLLVISAQASIIAVKNERLRCIEKMARHQQVVDPWMIIDIVVGVSD